MSSDVSPLSWAVRYVKLISATKLYFQKDKQSHAANEISYKWSSASLLQIDYSRGVVFPTSALISAAKTPLVLFLERVVPVWQLGVSEGAWCVVSLLDVTLSRACYSFFNLLCQSHALSLSFVFSSIFLGLCLALLSLSSFLATFSFSFLSSYTC